MLCLVSVTVSGGPRGRGNVSRVGRQGQAGCLECPLQFLLPMKDKRAHLEQMAGTQSGQ